MATTKTQTTAKPAAKTLQGKGTTTTAKTATAKTHSVGKKAGAEQKAVQAFAYAQLLSDAISGKFGPIIARFYKNAISHHTKQGTTFPRAAYAGAVLMPAKDVPEWFDKFAKTGIPNARTDSRRLFDQMMVERNTQNMQAGK